MYENSDSFRDVVGLERYGVTPTVTVAPSDRTKITLRYEYLNDDAPADRGITSFEGRPADVDVATFYGNPTPATWRPRSTSAQRRSSTGSAALTLRNHTLVANYDRFYQNFVPGAVTPHSTQVALTSYNNATDRTNVFNQTDASSRPLHRAAPAHAARRSGVRPPADGQLPQHGFLQQRDDLAPRALGNPTIGDAGDVPAERHRCRQPCRRQGGGGLRAGSDRAVAPRPARGRPALRSLRPHLPQQPQRRHAGPSRQPRLATRRPRLQADRAGLGLRQLQRVVSSRLRRSVLLADGDHPAAQAGEVQQLRGRREVGRVAGLLG